jgi:hypothetical protein
LNRYVIHQWAISDQIFSTPKNTRALFPNPAFENMTLQDGYWGAKLVMSFTDEQLEILKSDPKESIFIDTHSMDFNI